jgi:hypothetical protein
LKPYTNNLYQNDDEMRKLESSTNVALSRGQTMAINDAAKRGMISVNKPSDVEPAIKTVDDIIARAKEAATNVQLNKMNTNRTLSSQPTSNAVNSANTVADQIMKSANYESMSVILIPGNEPIPLRGDSNTETTQAIVGGDGIVVSTNKSAKPTTLDSTTIGNRASVAVDANVAVVPTNKVANDNISIAESSKHAATAAANKLSQYAKSIGTSLSKSSDTIGKETGNIVQQVEKFASGVADLFKGKHQSSTVVPVSKNLSVLSSSPTHQAVEQMPEANNTIERTTKVLYNKYSTHQSKMMGGDNSNEMSDYNDHTTKLPSYQHNNDKYLRLSEDIRLSDAANPLTGNYHHGSNFY